MTSLTAVKSLAGVRLQSPDANKIPLSSTIVLINSLSKATRRAGHIDADAYSSPRDKRTAQNTT